MFSGRFQVFSGCFFQGVFRVFFPMPSGLPFRAFQIFEGINRGNLWEPPRELIKINSLGDEGGSATIFCGRSPCKVLPRRKVLLPP